MYLRWVNYTTGAPLLADFLTTQGQGAPLCVDVTTGQIYYLAAGDIPTPIPSGGGGGGSKLTSGLATLDFGAFPGATDTSVTITGQASILATSLVSAVVLAKASSDHTADEHWVDPPTLTAGNIVPGTGFTIYGTSPNLRAYGQWSIGWFWS